MTRPGGDEHAAVHHLLLAIDAGDADAARKWLVVLLLALGREWTAGVVREHEPPPGADVTDRESLYAAVLDDPHADTPRRVLADYLDDYASELPDPDKARHRAAMIRGLLDPAGPQRWRTHFPDVAAIAHRDRRIAVWIDGYCHERPDIQTHQEDAEPAFYFTHGFLREVRLPLAAFVGGECGRCSGEGCSPHSVAANGPCRSVPGLARELFAAHPLTKCVLTCREPNEDGGEWQWASARDTSGWRLDVHRSSLPWAIAEHLKGGRHVKESRSVVAQWWYDTRDDALTALSGACCAYGRALAGLRPLAALPPTPVVPT